MARGKSNIVLSFAGWRRNAYPATNQQLANRNREKMEPDHPAPKNRAAGNQLLPDIKQQRTTPKPRPIGIPMPSWR